MRESQQKAIQNAAASSAMEGLPLSQQDIELVQKILDGELTLQEYLASLVEQVGKE